VTADADVLELGCGYGRIALRLAARARMVVGIDVAEESLALAVALSTNHHNCQFMNMDAMELTFDDASFDLVVCAQNGICAFNVDPARLIRQSMRVVRPGGRMLISTYTDAFWPYRLAWFEAQAQEGLLGPIDHESSGDGTIVCRDGFRAGRMRAEDFSELCTGLGLPARILEVDGSSLFCEIDC
jgi:2-polyprenyl-6-hydroxyphenyl methylase/3-demethylubiquinone-9 3-methyltransferase